MEQYFNLFVLSGVVFISVEPASGSIIGLTQSPEVIKQDLTKTVNVTCSLQDSASLDAIHDDNFPEHYDGLRDEIKRRHQKQELADRLSVEETSDDMFSLLSIIVSHNGSDIAPSQSVNLLEPSTETPTLK